jgi:hypothetical protein
MAAVGPGLRRESNDGGKREVRTTRGMRPVMMDLRLQGRPLFPAQAQAVRKICVCNLRVFGNITTPFEIVIRGLDLRIHVSLQPADST